MTLFSPRAAVLELVLAPAGRRGLGGCANVSGGVNVRASGAPSTSVPSLSLVDSASEDEGDKDELLEKPPLKLRIAQAATLLPLLRSALLLLLLLL